MKSPKQLNPNWAQLRQKLSHGSQSSSKKQDTDTQETILEKRKEKSDNRETDECEMNVRTPTSSDSSGTVLQMQLPVMDCEMVGVSPLGNKSAFERVTLVKKYGNVIYNEHVCSVERVVDFCTKLSGIRPRDLKKAFIFKEVSELLKDRILVGHALCHDLKASMQISTGALLLSHPKKDIRDTADYQPFLKDERSKALRHPATEVLGFKIQNGKHFPIEDACAAMMLYMNRKREWEKFVKDYVKMRVKQRKHKPN